MANFPHFHTSSPAGAVFQVSFVREFYERIVNVKKRKYELEEEE